MPGSNSLMRAGNALNRTMVVFIFAYMFDYGFTAVMMLWNEGWVDMAHFLFTPFIGVHGYLALRAVLLVLAAAFYHRLSAKTAVRVVYKALAAYYVLVCFWNLGSGILFT